MISMVMPVYNEESFMFLQHLELASPYIDEIIVVDGSPQGPSTDKTQEIAKTFENVRIIEGTYELSDWGGDYATAFKGGWDKKAQFSAGIKASSNDIILLTSVDIIYDDYDLLVSMIKSSPTAKIFYSFMIEFFIDTNHVRMNPGDEFPRPNIGYPIIHQDSWDPDSTVFLDTSQFVHIDKMFLSIFKYHYGWIRPFDIQLRRHIKNVKSGLWGEYGDNILTGGEKMIDIWAITHILHYEKDVYFHHHGNSQHPLGKFDTATPAEKNVEFSYMQGFEEVLQNFREKHGVDYFDCVKL